MNAKVIIPVILVAAFIYLFAAETPKSSDSTAVDAYIYGYPLVTMEQTRLVSTNVEKPDGFKAPVGQFANLRTYPDPSFRVVTAPNADTLYSAAWLDLSTEPYVLSTPNENGRYFLLPMLSGWTDVFDVPGTRTTGTDAQKYAITGPNWKGTLPGDLKEIKSPTNMVWIIGRTYCTGTEEDYKAVHAIQDQYALVPLSSYGKAYTPPVGKVDPNINDKIAVRDQVNQMDPVVYFNTLARLMKDNPPSPKDADIIARMAKIGIVPGQKFDISKLDEKTVEEIKSAPKKALEKIIAHKNQAGVLVNGWVYSTETGVYKTDYLQRAFITAFGLGANLPQDAIYPVSETDIKGQPYSGNNKYVVHFNKDETPPVKGFWSLTMYDSQMFFVENPLNRYSISARNDLKTNPDGSIDLYIQNESPGKDKESNWLPAPKDKFVLMFRFYWPEEALIKGTWKPPIVKQVP